MNGKTSYGSYGNSYGCGKFIDKTYDSINDIPKQCDLDSVSLKSYYRLWCCDMSQNDTIGKIELNPSIVLSSDNTNCKNDIQLFHQLFDELSVHRDYH